MQNRARKHLHLDLIVGVREPSLRTQPQASPPGTSLSELLLCQCLEMILGGGAGNGRQNSSCKLKTVPQLTRKMSNFTLFFIHFFLNHTIGPVEVPSLTMQPQDEHEGRREPTLVSWPLALHVRSDERTPHRYKHTHRDRQADVAKIKTKQHTTE